MDAHDGEIDNDINEKVMDAVSYVINQVHQEFEMDPNYIELNVNKLS